MISTAVLQGLFVWLLPPLFSIEGNFRFEPLFPWAVEVNFFLGHIKGRTVFDMKLSLPPVMCSYHLRDFIYNCCLPIYSPYTIILDIVEPCYTHGNTAFLSSLCRGLVYILSKLLNILNFKEPLSEPWTWKCYFRWLGIFLSSSTPDLKPFY